MKWWIAKLEQATGPLRSIGALRGDGVDSGNGDCDQARGE